MKPWILALVSIALLLSLTACGAQPQQSPSTSETTAAPTEPPTLSGFPVYEYDIRDYDSFSDLVSVHCLAERGTYSIRLTGLDTPVVVDMRGSYVQGITAYGQSVLVAQDVLSSPGDEPVDIRSIPDALIVNVKFSGYAKTYIINSDQYMMITPQDDIATQVFAEEDGSLSYHRYWMPYENYLKENATALLDMCSSRDQLLYETGSAQLQDASVTYTPENTVTVSDEYDLDALFAQAKADGMYEQYETVDELLAANRAGDPEGEV